MAKKRSIYVSDADEPIYEKAMELFGESLAKVIANTLREKVEQHEALQAGMSEQTVHKGMTHQHDNIFLGNTAKFTGVKIAEGFQKAPNEDQSLYVTVYLTKKNRFLLSWDVTDAPEETVTSDYKDYDNYNEIKSGLEKPLLEQCEGYLSKNSTIRTYEILDV